MADQATDESPDTDCVEWDHVVISKARPLADGRILHGARLVRCGPGCATVGERAAARPNA